MSELIELLANNQPSSDVTKRAERLIIEAVILGMDGVGMDEMPPLLSVEEEREEARQTRRSDSSVPNANVINARSSSSLLVAHNSNKSELTKGGALPTLLSDDFELIVDEENGLSPPLSSFKRNESGSPVRSNGRCSVMNSSTTNGASLFWGQQRDASGTAGSNSTSPTKAQPPRLLPPIERAGGSVISSHRAAASPSPTKMMLNGGGGNGRVSSASPNPGAQSPQRQLLPPIGPSRLTPISPSRGQQLSPLSQPSKFDSKSSVRPANVTIRGEEDNNRSVLSQSESSLLFGEYTSTYRPAMSPKGLRYVNARHPVTGATALHIACDRGHFDVIELLVTSGADTNALDGVAAMEADLSKGRGTLSLGSLVVGGQYGNGALLHASAGPPHQQQEQHSKQYDDDDGDESDGWPILSTKEELLGLAGRGYTPLQCLLRDARHPPTRVAAAAEIIIKESFTVGAPPLSSPTARRRKSKQAPAAPREPIRGAVSKEYLRRLEEERAREEQERKEREEHERAEVERLRRANSYSSKAFYQKGFDPNVRASAGLKATALHFACEMGHLSVVPLLLETGADPNIPDEKGVTPLIFLLANNPPYPNVAGIARQIVATQGFNPNHVDASGRCALHLACQLKHYAVVSQLMASGADPNMRDTSLKGFGNTPLHWLLASPIMAPHRQQQQGRAREGREVPTRTDTSGVNTTRRSRVSTSESAGIEGSDRGAYYPSALIKAAQHIIFGCSSSRRSQLLAGDWWASRASVGASIRFSMPTALSFSVTNRLVLDTRNEAGRTSLHYACDLGHIEVALLLLKAGADAGAVDKQGQTPLHLACPNSFPIVGALVANGGADVNALDINKRTPIDTLQERYLAIREMVAERAKRSRRGWSLPRARQTQQLGQGSNSSRRGVGDARRGLLRRADALFDDGQEGDRYTSTDPSLSPTKPPLILAFTPPDYADESAMNRLTDLFDRAFDLLRAEGGTKSPIGRYSLQRR